MLGPDRLPDLRPNRLSTARKALENRGGPLLDLTGSNPTSAGLTYPPDLLAPLADPRGLLYAPDPRGLDEARHAVTRELARHGATVSADRILLTASTSEAYAFLFKRLCLPGDEVLVPVPSYPLFELLGRLEAVQTVPYPLDAHGGWTYDVGAIAARVTPRTRAIVIVSPNNPTGTVVTAAEARALSALCLERDLVLIADEVFADYRLPGAPGPACILADTECLAVSLGGLSKAVGLPQVKLAWMAVGGSPEVVDPFIAGLELIADTFLSVGTPVQAALPELLARGVVVRDQIRERLARNLATARRHLDAAPAIQLLEPQGGWTAVLRVPATRTEEALALELLERHEVVVQPGYFYDFPTEAWLVVSLLVEPGTFARGLERLVALSAGEPSKSNGTPGPDLPR